MKKYLLTLLLRATRKALLLSTLATAVASALVGPHTALQAIGRSISHGVGTAATYLSEKQLDWRDRDADADRERFVAAVARRKELTATIARLSTSRNQLKVLLGEARESLVGRLGETGASEREAVVDTATVDTLPAGYEAEQALAQCLTLERQIARYDTAIARLKSLDGTLELLLSKTGRSLTRHHLELCREREAKRGHRLSDEALTLIETMKTLHEER